MTKVDIQELLDIDYETYDFEHLISENGAQLVSDSNPVRPKLTVELESKWYSLYLICEGSLRKVGFEWLESIGGEPAFVDHVPNPASVRKLAEDSGWELCGLAEELIEGRWALEPKGASRT